MKFSILTLFPEMVYNTINTSITARGIKSGNLCVETIDIREFSTDRNKRVDDYSYGGGAGMIIGPECVYRAYRSIDNGKKKRVVYMSPKGRTFDMKLAKEFAKEEEIVILCGHYEGIDERVLEEIVTDYVSIGDYVLTGGELAACVVVDATSRFCKGVLGNDESATVESFFGDLLEYPQYTRPVEWHDKKVPEVLLSGNKKRIDEYRLELSEAITKESRPDLYEKYIERKDIINKLLKNKKQNAPLIDILSKQAGYLCYSDKENLVVCSEEENAAYVYICKAFDAFNLLMQKFPGDISAVCSSDRVFVDFLKENGFGKTEEFVQAVYTEKVTRPVKHKSVRNISASEVSCFENLPEKLNRDYMSDAEKSGNLYGIFAEDKLVGICGYTMSRIDFVYVTDEYRRKGYGLSLEGFAINRILEDGGIPFMQIPVGGSDVLALQKALKMYESERTVFWVYR